MLTQKNFAILISGFGRGAIEIIKDFKFGLIQPHIGLVISSSPHSRALKIAEENGIPTAVFQPNLYRTKFEFEAALVQALRHHNIDYIFLAGWMQIIGRTLLQEYPRKIVNIHPSLLPSFKGLRPFEQALNSGVKITGVTTHFVDETIDGGEIILQETVRIEEGDDVKKLDNKIFKIGTLVTTETINKIFL